MSAAPDRATCQVEVWRGSEWHQRPEACGNIAGPDGLCGIHRRAKEGREAREAAWAARRDRKREAVEAVAAVSPFGGYVTGGGETVTIPVAEFIAFAQRSNTEGGES